MPEKTAGKRTERITSITVYAVNPLDPNGDLQLAQYPEEGYNEIVDFRHVTTGQATIVKITQRNKETGEIREICQIAKTWAKDSIPID